MNCDQIRPLLSDYYDGEASQEEIARVERHLVTCQECRQVVSEYRAIGGGLRAMPVPVPPAGLRRDVWRAIDAGNRHGAASPARMPRPSGIAVLKGGKAAEKAQPTPTSRGWGGRVLPAVGVAAVLLLALTAVLLLNNRNPVQAAGLREKSPISDYNQTLHVEFSRVVNSGDVIAYSYVEQVNGDATQTVDTSKNYDAQARVLSITPKQPWVQGQNYQVVVEADKIHTGVATQTLGTKPINLQFSAASYTPTSTSTSTPTATATATTRPSETPKPTNTPEPTAIAQNTQIVPPPAGSPTSQPSHTPVATATSTHMPPTGTATATSTARPTGTQTPGPTDTQVPATSTATVTLTATVTPHRSTPTLTPRATSTATPRATATPTPWNACSIQPVNGFGKLWKDDTSVRSRLGCPTAHELGIQLAAEQHFQGGYMFWRGDTKTVYVFLGGATGDWYEFEDTWQDTDPTPAPLGAPAGLYEPVRGFGKIWRDYPGLRQSLGWATDQETNITAAWEAFQGGNMIWTSSTRQIRIMYDDASRTYETYQDTFNTPTPAAANRPSD